MSTTRARTSAKRPAKQTAAPIITATQIRRLVSQLERKLGVAWIRVDRRTLKLKGVETSRRLARLRCLSSERIVRVALRVQQVPV